MSDLTSVQDVAQRMYLAAIEHMTVDLDDPKADELMTARLALIQASDELLDRLNDAVALLA